MALIIFNLEKDFRQDNLPFVCLQFYKHNFLNIHAGNICFRIQVKKSIEMAVTDTHSISSSGTFISHES